MTKQELKAAVALAVSDEDLSSEWNQIDIFDGFALPEFKPVAVTIKQVAALVRWQCCQLYGGLNADSLNEIRNYGRKRFEIIG